MTRIFFFTIMLLICLGCTTREKEKKDIALVKPYRLITLHPGHFHAALVQKKTYPEIDSVVHLYAPEGNDLQLHLERISDYNIREVDPTNWIEKVYVGDDFLEKMLAEKPGNIVIISGDNARKTEFISKSISARLHVLADKPMIIHPDDFQELISAFDEAEQNNVLLYDIMTERFEITTILQRELSQIPEIFGKLLVGDSATPAITKESVHHFSKQVSGKPLIRPDWFFDVSRQGEGIVDVTTHLVDLVQWECFPEIIIDYQNDIEVVEGRRWPTVLNIEQFEKVTGINRFPPGLENYVNNEELHVFSNGEIIFRIKGIYAKVSVIWNFEAPAGAGDTHYSIMRGTVSDLLIEQGREEGYIPELYILFKDNDQGREEILMQMVNSGFGGRFEGLGMTQVAENKYRIDIPDHYRLGHEAHFSQVVDQYIQYLEAGKLPEWEIPNMISKYFITTEAYKMAQTR